MVLEHGGAEGPDAGEAEVQFVPLLGTVERCVRGVEKTVEQVTQHLDVRHLHYGRDLLEARAHVLQTRRYVLVEQDHQVGLLRGVLSRLYPTRHIPTTKLQCSTTQMFVYRTPPPPPLIIDKF